MNRSFQDLTQHKEWLVLGDFCVLGIVYIGYGLFSPVTRNG